MNRIKFFVLAVAVSGIVSAQECPPGPNKVTVDVTASVTYSSKTKLYTYNYTLTSSPQSLQMVDSFTIDLEGAVSSLTGPTGWLGRLITQETAAKWSPMEPEPLPPGVEDDESMPAPLHGIRPGSTLSGFSFQSPLPPGPRPYYISGFAPPPGQPSEEDAEAFLERCPDFGKDYFHSSVLGSVQGPTNVGAMQIDILPGDPSNSLDPRSTGTITVAVLADRGYSLPSIEAAFTTFGRGGQRPLNWFMQDVNNDGKTELVLQFDIPATHIECQDIAAFLYTRTNQGTILWGSDSISTGCR